MEPKLCCLHFSWFATSLQLVVVVIPETIDVKSLEVPKDAVRMCRVIITDLEYHQNEVNSISEVKESGEIVAISLILANL